MGCKSTTKSITLYCNYFILDSLRINELVFNSTTSTINLPGVAITDYLPEFSESVVANIDFVGEPISGVTLDPANASINIDGLFISVQYLRFNNQSLLQSLSLDLMTLSTQ